MSIGTEGVPVGCVLRTAGVTPYQLRTASYLFNVTVIADGPNNATTGGDRPIQTIASIPFPADQPVYYDGWLSVVSLGSPVEGRHSSGANVGYADAHTKFFRLEYNKTPTKYDPFFQKYRDQWYINSGPFRSPSPTSLNYEFQGIVDDPVCTNGNVDTCTHDT
jgi:prepilin-type processing-associated H-X9-DG protein